MTTSKLKALNSKYTNRPTYIQTTHNTTGVYTLDLNALDTRSTTAMERKWSCINTFIALGNTRVSNCTSRERVANTTFVYHVV